MFKDSTEDNNKDDKRYAHMCKDTRTHTWINTWQFFCSEKPEKEPSRDAPKGSAVSQTPGRAIKSSGGALGVDKKGENVLSPRKKP